MAGTGQDADGLNFLFAKGENEGFGIDEALYFSKYTLRMTLRGGAFNPDYLSCILTEGFDIGQLKQVCQLPAITGFSKFQIIP